MREEERTGPSGLAAGSAARGTLELANSKPFCLAVRVGFMARGLTYALIAGIAIALASGAGSRGTAPDQQGALSLIAGALLGRIALAVAAVGLAAYALWKLALAVIGVGPEGYHGRKLFDRIANLAGGLVYVAFCVLTVRVLFGSAGSQTRQQRGTASAVLHWPAGPGVVGGAGLVLVAICLYQVYVGARGSFADDAKTGEMGTKEEHSYMWLGRLGLISRAIVFGLSGYFLIRTATDGKLSRGIGVDGALAEVHAQPFGNVLLIVVSAGLLVFAVFSFLEARRRRL